ncbi:MAG TPA: TRIC cation channel family protein [Planctomycetota bacterium]|nr:TRIC cation channel family protein [Planctomycetota bacterium]
MISAQDSLQRYLFQLPPAFDIGAVFFFAVTGAVVAVKRGYDLVGLFAMSLISGLGGALIRDGIFLQNGPPALTRDWRYLAAVLAGAGVGWILGLRLERFQRVIALIDAVGLGAYGVFGTCLSLAAGLSYPAAVLVGVVNASGGGLLRDLITREEPLLLKPGQLYVLASMMGCIVFILLVLHTPLSTAHAAWAAIGLTFTFRVLAIAYNWRTRPVTEWRRRRAAPPGAEPPPGDDKN